jgi:transcriptional regulator with XRE-family HTH domain
MIPRHKHMADNLKRAIISKGCTQTDLAADIGLTRATINAYFTGKQEPFQESFLKIAERLNVEPEFLVLPQAEHPAKPDAFLTPLESEILKVVDDAIALLLEKGKIADAERSPSIPLPANIGEADRAFLAEIVALILPLSTDDKQAILTGVQALRESFDELNAEEEEKKKASQKKKA